MVEVAVQTQGMEEVAGFLQDFNALLNNREPLLRLLGQTVRDNLKTDIEEDRTPAGRASLKRTHPKYVALEKKADNKPLKWKGRFQRGWKYQITGEGVEVGVTAPYAQVLLRGGKNRNTRKGWPKTTYVYARPFLGVYGRDLTEFMSRLKLRLAHKRGAA